MKLGTVRALFVYFLSVTISVSPPRFKEGSSKLTFFFIMMGYYRWNSAATRIISPQLTNYYYGELS